MAAGLVAGSDISIYLPLSSLCLPPLLWLSPSHTVSTQRERHSVKHNGREQRGENSSGVMCPPPQTGRTGAGATPWKFVLHSRSARKLPHPNVQFVQMSGSEIMAPWILFILNINNSTYEMKNVLKITIKRHIVNF